MREKSKIKKVFIYVLIFFLMINFFCISMVVSYAIPNDNIYNNLKDSKEYVDYATKNNVPIFGNKIMGLRLDGYTDALILNMAINKGKSENESILIRAFENSKCIINNDPIVGLDYLLDNENAYNNEEYSRYWHGIQSIIRPLLVFFDYEEIRYIFMILMFILLGISVLLIYKNLSTLHSIAFMSSMIIIGFFIVSVSLQYIGAFAVSLITVIIINVLYKKDKMYLIPYLFFIVGGVATFYDLLTVPLITLAIPLEIVILLEDKKNKLPRLKDIIIYILKISAIWCISYAATFLMKWVIASIVLHKDAVSLAVNQLLFRVNGNEDYPTTRLGAIQTNLCFLYNKPFALILMNSLIIWFVMFIKYRKVNKIIIGLIIICLYPYIWYFTFAGHSMIHAWFTYRLQIITIFGIFCIMIEALNFEKIKNEFKNRGCKNG